MLHRDDPQGLIVITQPAHAWISGQLARAWGNVGFSAPQPHEAMCLAAEQHDIGWLEWERVPSLNSNTGHPHAFLELPVPVHTKIWSAAGSLALVQGGRYVALLVSRHGSGLYERRDTSADSPQDAQLIREYLSGAHAFENEMIAALRTDAVNAPFVETAALARNSRLIGVWDYLSLMLCMGLNNERAFEHVPKANGETTLTLAPVGGDSTQIAVSPWPFRSALVELQCEGRRLGQTFSNESEMRAALSATPRLILKFTLRPGT